MKNSDQGIFIDLLILLFLFGTCWYCELPGIEPETSWTESRDADHWDTTSHTLTNHELYSPAMPVGEFLTVFMFTKLRSWIYFVLSHQIE